MKYVLWPFHWFADWRYRREAKRLGIKLGWPDGFEHEWID